jgi:hypothetical protein
VKDKLRELSVADPDAFEIQNSLDSELVPAMVEHLYDRLQRRGFTERDVRRMVNQDRNVFASLLVALGHGDAMITGLTRTFAQTMREVSLVLDPKPGALPFGIHLMIGKNYTVFLADTTIFQSHLVNQIVIDRMRFDHRVPIRLGVPSSKGNPALLARFRPFASVHKGDAILVPVYATSAGTNVRRRTDARLWIRLQRTMLKDTPRHWQQDAARRNGNLRAARLVHVLRRLRGALVHCVALSAALLLAPVDAIGEGSTVILPENASASHYADRWVCNRGYRETDGACAAVELPLNAYLTGSALGRGWECRRGYVDRDAACVLVYLPKNAYLISQRGDVWKCARGFSTVDDACVAIRVPENAFLTASTHGTGWECDRGYRSTNESCVELRVPENAHIDYSGHEWECDRPYRKQGGECVLR